MRNEKRRWLTLSAASKLLGVHPATLRQWADAGQVPSYRTPGGHRRFDADELRQFLLRASAGPSSAEEEALSPADMMETALIQTRNELRSARLDEKAWRSAFDEAGKERQRTLGRQLFDISVQLLTNPDQRQTLWQRGRTLGQAYASSAIEHHLSLLETVRAFHFFRSNLFKALDADDTSKRLSSYCESEQERELDLLLNEVLYGLIDAYENEMLGEKTAAERD